MKNPSPVYPRRLLTVNEVCQALGLCRTTVYELLNQGAIAYVKVGERRRIPVSEIDRIEREARRAELL